MSTTKSFLEELIARNLRKRNPLYFLISPTIHFFNRPFPPSSPLFFLKKGDVEAIVKRSIDVFDSAFRLLVTRLYTPAGPADT